MAFTESCSTTILNGLIGRATGGPLATCYLALSTTAPNTAGGNFTEPSSSTGYARSFVGASSGGATNVMSVPSGGSTSNIEIMFFPEATASWGTITYFGLFTAKTGGTLQVYGPLTSPVTVPANYVPLFRVGNFTMSIV